MRHMLVIPLCLLGLAGCKPLALSASKPAPPIAAMSATASADDVRGRAASQPPGPAAAGLDAQLMATVNGKPIYMQELVEPLVDVHGLLLAEMLVADQVVSQEAAARNIAVADQDIADENTRSLRGLFRDELKPDQRARVLDDLLRRRGLTRRIWDSTMRRNALLRKMVSPQVNVNEAMLKSEFARLYGEKVQASHIQLPTLNEAQKIQAMLKDGQEFGELARRYSTNTATAKDGGMLLPFTRDSVSLPQAMRDAAFAAREGEVTGVVSVGDSYHLLKVHKRFPPEKADFEAVKETLRQDLSDRITERLQADLLMELRRKADVKFADPSLLKQAQAQQAAPPGQ